LQRSDHLILKETEFLIMVESILNNNVPRRAMRAAPGVILRTSLLLMVLLILYLIWSSVAIAVLQQAQTPAQIQNALVDTALAVLICAPLGLLINQELNQWEESQSFFNKLFQHSVEPIVLYSLDGHILACNPALNGLLGYSAEALKGKRLQDLILSDGQELAYLFRSADSGQSAKATLALETSDQRVIFVIAHEQRILIRGKVRLLTFFEDVTARHLENQRNQIFGQVTSTLLKLQELRQVHQTVCAELVRSADSLVVLLAQADLKLDQMDIIERNGAPRKLEFFNRWSSAHYPEGLRRITISRCQKAWLLSEQLTSFDCPPDQFPRAIIPPNMAPPKRILARRLSLEESQLTAVMVLDFEAKLDLAFSEQLVYLFITAIKRLNIEARLQRSQLLLSETQKLVRVGHLQYDFVSGRSHISDELCALCGMPHSASDVALIRLIHPDDRPAFAQLLDTIIAYPVRDEIRFNFRLVKPGGQTLYLRSHSKIHFDQQGKAQYLLTAIHDTTELMAARDELYHWQASSKKLLSGFDELNQKQYPPN
jgi:PAS domain S-box-containing protein